MTMDVTRIATFFTQMGVAGLKRFAEAGVHTHTLVCMWEIAEKCPASMSYRKELNDCRRKQREGSILFYEAVEIGASTNFVADRLLNDRAGENAVALMSSILTVMAGSYCDNLLLKLFEKSAVALQNTPGFGQLRAIRETLMPLARKTGFKDHVWHSHKHARNLLGKENHASEAYAYESIPEENTAVQVILFLARIAQEDAGLTLQYSGLKGAGWTIAYARYVLGLPVCILISPHESIPVLGDYESAKVFVHIFEPEGKCQLFRKGEPKDCFETKSIAIEGQHGWLIDPKLTNVLDSFIPPIEPVRRHISLMARLMANEYMQVLSYCLSIPTLVTDPPPDLLCNQGLISYPLYCLQALRRKAQMILSTLGFSTVSEESMDSKSISWSDYVQIHDVTEQDSLKITATDSRPVESNSYLVAGHKWVKYKLGHFELNQEGPIRAGKMSQNAKLDKTAVRYMTFLFQIVDAACWLAFTDWDQHSCVLAVSYLDTRRTWKSCLLSKRPLIKMLDINNHRELYKSVKNICKNSIAITVGGQESWTPDFSDDKLVAFEHFGFVLAQNTTLEHNLDLNACFLRIIPGRIVFNGERQERIWDYSNRPHAVGKQTEPVSEGTALKPTNQFDYLSVTKRMDVSPAQGIMLQRTVVVGLEVYWVPGPGSTLKALKKLCVTEPCGHSYYDELVIGNGTTLRGEFFRKAHMRQGLFLAGSEKVRQKPEVWLQLVDQNAFGQWLAYQTAGDDGYLTILQRNCCFACVCKKIEAAAKKWSFDEMTVRVISGRLTGEHMD